MPILSILLPISTPWQNRIRVTQKNIDSSLRVAKDVMTKTGQIAFSGETVTWQAKNQYSNDVKAVMLPNPVICKSLTFFLQKILYVH